MTSPNGRVHFTLNGEPVNVSSEHPHLLSALREELHVLSPKDGCAPQGQCGCCTVLVDGKARIACSTSLERIADTEITTLEGFEEGERERLATAFAVTGALQCGFCTPGILMASVDFLSRHAEPTREEITEMLSGQLCRCTGYVPIVDAIERAAARLRSAT